MQIKNYSNAINSKYNEGYDNSKFRQSNKMRREDSKVDDALSSLSQNKILSDNERSFFKNLFPDSSNQIERHVVFNRNGKLQNSNMSKGKLFDVVV